MLCYFVGVDSNKALTLGLSPKGREMTFAFSPLWETVRSRMRQGVRRTDRGRFLNNIDSLLT